MDKIRTGLKQGMAGIIQKNRSKLNEEKKSNIAASTGFQSAKNSVSPYKDENLMPNKQTPTPKRTPVVKK